MTNELLGALERDMDRNQEKIAALEADETFQPVKDRPGYWLDTTNGEIFHYTKFMVLEPRDRNGA